MQIAIAVAGSAVGVGVARGPPVDVNAHAAGDAVLSGAPHEGHLWWPGIAALLHLCDSVELPVVVEASTPGVEDSALRWASVKGRERADAGVADVARRDTTNRIVELHVRAW